MEKITWLISQLNSIADERRIPIITFEKSNLFSWNHTTGIIQYDPAAQNAIAYTLHEFCHAALHHQDYSSDIALIKMERDAWHEAQMIAKDLAFTIDSEVIEDALNTYRDWLHSRSLCPNCDSTGIQSKIGQYHCVSCDTTWRANEARTCALRRYSNKKTPK